MEMASRAHLITSGRSRTRSSGWDEASAFWARSCGSVQCRVTPGVDLSQQSLCLLLYCLGGDRHACPIVSSPTREPGVGPEP